MESRKHEYRGNLGRNNTIKAISTVIMAFSNDNIDFSVSLYLGTSIHEVKKLGRLYKVKLQEVETWQSFVSLFAIHLPLDHKQ